MRSEARARTRTKRMHRFSFFSPFSSFSDSVAFHRRIELSAQLVHEKGERNGSKTREARLSARFSLKILLLFTYALFALGHTLSLTLSSLCLSSLSSLGLSVYLLFLRVSPFLSLSLLLSLSLSSFSLLSLCLSLLLIFPPPAIHITWNFTSKDQSRFALINHQA